ncbi:class I lanthipeptide [Kordia sp. SMS9]|uniref:class I lanthipeptide n=1 Tax=Kordia sp. SMS9 TaxID=2282170 RepID=UPI00196400EA
MKKKNLKNLSLNKNSISKLQHSTVGGVEKSERRTNCPYCPQSTMGTSVCEWCPTICGPFCNDW